MIYSQTCRLITAIALLLSSSTFVYSQQNTQTVQEKERDQYAPGQVLISYKKTGFKSANSTYESIEKDYTKIRSITSQLEKSVTRFQPVYSYLIQKMKATNKTEQELLQNRISASTLKNNNITFNFAQNLLLSFDSKIDVSKIIDLIKDNRNLYRRAGYEIETIQPNYLYYTNSELPNDEFINIQWGLFRMNCPEAWKISTGNKNIKIAIIDSGIDLEHEDLKDNISKDSYDFVDIDTLAYKRANYQMFKGEDYTDPDDYPMDFYGHGTHCAGIIGAIQNNNIGISGICPNVSLMAIRAGFSIKKSYSDRELGILQDDDIANAIMYAIDNGADVISMSFSSNSTSSTIQQSLQYAHSKDVILVAASGNHYDNTKHYPAASDHVISVSALNNQDKKATFSSYGDWIDIIAPGEAIYSTIPTAGGSNTNKTGYATFDGTSTAAPAIAAICGLIKSVNKNLTAQAVEDILKMTVNYPVDLGIYYGAGVANAHKAILKANASFALGEFTSPKEYEMITDAFTINGRHAGTIANVSIGNGIYPTTWKSLLKNENSNQVSIDMTLDELEDGLYTLKLETILSNDTANYYRHFFVANFKNMQAGWPIKINTEGKTYAFAIGDLNSDGFQEIVIASCVPRGHKNPYKNSGSIYVYNYKGELLPDWPYNFPKNETPYIKPILCDVDNDGTKEIIINSTCNLGDNHFGENQISVLNLDGTIRDGWPTYIPSSGRAQNISVADIDSDGIIEIICAAGGGLCSSCDGPGGIHVFDIDGNYKPGWPVIYGKHYIPRSNFAIANIDDDQELEILITKHSKSEANDSLHYTCAYNHDGTMVSNFSVSQSQWGWPLATADVNNDGKSEIMTQYGLLTNTGAKVEGAWESLNPHIYSDITFANVDDDPELEICYGNHDEMLYIVNADGTQVSGWPISIDNLYIDKEIIVGDVLGDDKPEIIPLIRTNGGLYPNMAGINIYTIDGKPADGFPKFKGVYYIRGVELNDLDNDGDVEIIALDQDKNTLIVLDMEKQKKTSLQEWPCRYHDQFCTSNYSSKNNTSNHKPKIVGQQELVTSNDSIILSITDVIVEDTDNIFPKDFSLKVLANEHEQYDYRPCIGGTVVQGIKADRDSVVVHVTVSDHLDESDVFPLIIKRKNLSSTENTTFSSFLLYPNPTTGVVKMNLKNIVSKIELNVRNILGKIINKYEFLNTSQVSFMINDDPGVYYIELIINNNSNPQTFKVIKK
ncbi:T9SS type A sorting domain-containing protein [Prolixibacteraceae bacterium JC049]|nr:T9SS type A sorting domain-containing protein [Prolixibacteraceae bacterium JC049]